MKPGPDDLSWVVFLRSLDFIPLWEVGESSAVCCSNPYSVVLTEREPLYSARTRVYSESSDLGVKIGIGGQSVIIRALRAGAPVLRRGHRGACNRCSVGFGAEDGNMRGHDRNRVEVMDITPKALRRSLQTYLLSGNRDLGGENCKRDAEHKKPCDEADFQGPVDVVRCG